MWSTNKTIYYLDMRLTQKNLEVKRTLNYRHIENIIWFSKWQCHIIFDMKIFELNIFKKHFDNELSYVERILKNKDSILQRSK